MTTRRHRVAEARMYAYFAGMTAVGVLAILGDPTPAIIGALGSPPAAAVFGLWYALLGVLGVLARARRVNSAEALVVKLLALVTVTHAALLAFDGALASGARLALSVLVMLDWAAYRRGLALTDREVREVTRDRP